MGGILDRGRGKGFCQAGLNQQDDDSAVRPVEEVLGNGEAGSATVDNASSDQPGKPAEEDGQETMEEGRIMKGQKKVASPGREEWDNHMRTHIPYRKWCCLPSKLAKG